MFVLGKLLFAHLIFWSIKNILFFLPSRVVSSHLLKLKQERILYALLFESCLGFVCLFVFSFSTLDAREAVFANKSQFRNLYLTWELDHVTPGLEALQSHSSATRRALGPAMAFKIPRHLVLLPKTGLGRACLPLQPMPAGKWCPPVWPLTGALLPVGDALFCHPHCTFKVPSMAFLFQKKPSLILLARVRGVFLCVLDIPRVYPILIGSHLYADMCPATGTICAHGRCSRDHLWSSGVDYTLMFTWCVHVSIFLQWFESRNWTYSSPHATCLTEVPRNVWVEGKARLCAESMVEAGHSFPCITVIRVNSWVCGQTSSWGFVIRCMGIPECCGVGKALSYSPSHPHPLVCQMGMPLCMGKCWWTCSPPRQDAWRWWCWFTCWLPNCPCRKMPVKKKN